MEGKLRLRGLCCIVLAVRSHRQRHLLTIGTVRKHLYVYMRLLTEMMVQCTRRFHGIPEPGTAAVETGAAGMIATLLWRCVSLPALNIRAVRILPVRIW